jgi:hypothetical protein
LKASSVPDRKKSGIATRGKSQKDLIMKRRQELVIWDEILFMVYIIRFNL